MKKILIMGLPGSGKTTLAEKLTKHLNAYWLNADVIRKKYNDWDFSKDGIIRQVKRMKILADKSKKKIVVADFVCPIKEQFKIFKPDYVVWMDTIKKSRFESMNRIFQTPAKYDLRVISQDVKGWIIPILDKFKKKYRWNNKHETGQMLGRFQPFHNGHKLLFLEIIKKKGQAYIMIKDVNGIKDNPFTYSKIKKKIDLELKAFEGRYKIILAPNISHIYYGRKVGYSFEKIILPKEIQKISATKIRKDLRKKGIL